MPDRRFLAPLGALLAGCALLLQAHAQAAVPLSQSLTSVMASVEGYRAVNIQLGAEERRVAAMTDYVARAYMRDTTVAFTTFVSYYDKQTQGKTIHSPRNCLPGSGWEIVSGGIQTIQVAGRSHRVNRYLLRNGPAAALAYYWYQGRGRVTANEYAVKWNLLRDAALLGHTEEALVRVIIPVPASPASADAPDVMRAADSLAHRVAARLISEVEDVLPPGRARLASAM